MTKPREQNFPVFEGIDFEIWMPKAEAAYPLHILADLAKNHGIADETEFRELCQKLLFSGAAYLQKKSDAADFLKWQQRRKQIAEIGHRARQLRETIDALDDAASELLWFPEESLSRMQLLPPGKKGIFGHTVCRIKTGIDTEAVIILRRPTLLEGLAIISNYANHALASIPRRRESRHSGLQMWVTNMRSFWENCLHRKFTYSAMQGGGTSAAFQFCRDAIRPLDPNITDSSLQTAVRTVIADPPFKTASRGPRKINKNAGVA